MKPEQQIDGLTAFTSLFIRRPVLTIVLNLLIVVAGNLVGRLGVEQARTRNVTLGGWALVVMLMVIGFVEDVVRLDLEPEDAGDALGCFLIVASPDRPTSGTRFNTPLGDDISPCRCPVVPAGSCRLHA